MINAWKFYKNQNHKIRLHWQQKRQQKNIVEKILWHLCEKTNCNALQLKYRLTKMICLLIKWVQRLWNMWQIHAHGNGCRCNQNHIPKDYIKYLTSFWLNQTNHAGIKIYDAIKTREKRNANDTTLIATQIPESCIVLCAWKPTFWASILWTHKIAS